MSTKKQPNTPLTSEQISSFLNFLTQVQKDYLWNFEQQQKLEKLTQDYLHKLELEKLTSKEQGKIGVQLAKIRKQRREHKDSVELLTPIIEFIDSDIGKKLKNQLNERLGQTRKAEKKLGDRIYWFRVLQEPPIVDKENQEEN